MTADVADLDTAPGTRDDSPMPGAVRRRRARGGGHSLVARGEPVIWLTGAGLVICIVMIIGLLLLVLVQGVTTFWPGSLVQIRTISDHTLLGEVTRDESYELTFSKLATLTGRQQVAATRLLVTPFCRKLQRLQSTAQFSPSLQNLERSVERVMEAAVTATPAFAGGEQPERRACLRNVMKTVAAHHQTVRQTLERDLEWWLRNPAPEERLLASWGAAQQARQTWLAQPDLGSVQSALESDDQLLDQILRAEYLELLSMDVKVPVHRRLIRTGNFELTNEHFAWVSDFEIAAEGEKTPPWAILLERMAWGRFYGEPQALRIDGQDIAVTPENVWAEFQRYHPQVRERWRTRRRLETDDTGEVNRLLENERLHLRRIELQLGKSSAAWCEAQAEFVHVEEQLNARFAEIRSRIEALDQENTRYELVLRTSRGDAQAICLADIVRGFPANQLTWWDRLRIYGSRWFEFLTEDPREANSEGGVFPAIWGTVAMTLLMSLAVVPFGVLAALYLREYARAGMVVSTVRIAVNNLAGVPSVVFGVFGLGCFCYIVGASIDELLFRERLPNPTFGTGGLMWAAFTLALLTLPVVIVATEEALAAVPRSMREGSLACGATKWQTIHRIILPRAMPGIMTGTILAMARGAGEVAPLMLVGAVKLAPELPIDGTFPYLHMERSFMHLGFHIYDLGFQSQNSEAAKPVVFSTTLLLITIVAVMNLIAIWMRARLRRKFEYSQF